MIEPGKKVRVKTFIKSPAHWNCRMMEYCGNQVTIDRIKTSQWTLGKVKDQHKVSIIETDEWTFAESDFEPL